MSFTVGAKVEWTPKNRVTPVQGVVVTIEQEMLLIRYGRGRFVRCHASQVQPSTALPPITQGMTLGQAITFSATLHRKIERGRQADRLAWHAQRHAPRDGIYLGTRTLSDGTRLWESDEVGYIFSPNAYHTAALVAFSLTRNPVYVPMDAITIV